MIFRGWTMRKVIFAVAVLASMIFLSTCDLFTPGFGNNVDLSPPLLFVTSHSNGSYVHGTITLAGNFEEDVATASIEVSFDNGTTYIAAALNQQARTWSLVVDTTTVPDGERDVLFRITDTSNKTTDKKIMLYFDNTPPLVMMTVPSVYGGSATYYGSSFSVKGETADTFGVQSVTLQIWNDAETTMLASLPASGTASWTVTFNSETYVATTGTLKFAIVATDKAGNVSTKYYHYSDIYTANGYTTITIDDIYKIATGQLVNTNVKNFLDANGTTRIDLYFDQDSNKPTVEIYNPDQNQPASNNILGNTAHMSGKAIDEDSIAADSIKIRFFQTDDTPVTGWLTVGNTQAPSINWSYHLDGSIPDGQYQLRVQAQDIFGHLRETNPVGFIIATGAPTLEVTQPTQGQYLNGDFTISGTASADLGISRVEVSIDNGSTYNLATGTNNWSYNVGNPAEGSMLIKVKATDTNNAYSVYNLQVIVDKTNPTASFLNPAFSSTVNGLVLIRGTSSDNTQITNAEIRLGKDATWIPMSNLYNWEYEIDSTNYANATYSDDMGGGVWRFYVHARITDRAGNVYTKDDFYFLIDNNTDKPQVSILSPQAGAVIGGSTVMSGTAVDDDGLYHVYMSLDLDNDGLYTHQYNLNGDGTTGGSQIATVAGLPIGDPAQKFENEAYWYELSGTTQWTVELNANGELYHINGQNGQITARVVAVDSKDGGFTPDIKGNNQVRSFRFDDTIPGFENMSHDSNSFVRKTFTLTGRAVDDQHVDKIEISYNGGVNWTTIYDPPSTPWINQYDFSVPIDTTTINGGVFNNSSGILYLRLRATDNTGYTKLQLIDLKVDNSYPTNTYSGSLTDIHGSTTDSFVQGTATDSGTVSGIKQVEVYFMRGSTVYNPRTGATTTLTQTDFGDGTGPQYYTTDDNYKIVIDNKYENGASDLDGDGFIETFTVQGYDTLWHTQFNSLNISDGSITIHYVAVDMALNKHHYQTTGYIKNYKPIVDSLTVGSDVDFSNSVDADEKYPYSLSTYSSSNRFKARNRLFLQVTAHDPGGTVPGITSYNFLHEGVSVKNTTDNFLDTDLASYANGDTYFTCVITDGDNITTTTDTFWINVDRNDTTNPTIAIDAFDADGNPGNNIVAGHIELPADSKFDNGVANGDGTDDDADVSGIILLTGTAWDNFYVSSIQLTLDGVAPYPNPKTVAQWDNGTHQLASLDSNFTIVSQNITPAGGHTVTWSYRWDTSTVTNVTGANKTPLFTSSDAGSRTGVDTKSYDVVPYITGLLRLIGTEGTTRSKYGKFMIQQGETGLQIQGYNLAMPGTYGTNSWVRVCNTSGSSYSQVTNSTGTNITANNPYYTTLTIATFDNCVYSGWLRIMVNNVVTTNNINDNAKTNNKEDDGNGLASTLWTDDRYLEIWRVGTSFSGSTNANYPSMSIDTNGNLYGAWTDYTTPESVFYGTTSAKTAIFRMYDPAEFTDIHVDGSNNISVAFLGNYYGGTTWDYNPGNAGALAVWNSNAPLQYTYTLADNYYKFEDLYHSQMLMQFQRPRVVRSGNNIHVAYYDVNTSSVKYGYALNGAASTAEIGWINIDGGSNADDVRHVTGVATGRTNTTMTDTALIGNGLIATNQYIYLHNNSGGCGSAQITGWNSGTGQVTWVGTINTGYTSYTIITTTSNLVTQGVARSTSAGTYVAIDVDEQGYPVIMYYDIASQTLKLARATSLTPTAPADWTRQTVFQSGDPNKTYVGQYVAMKFDTIGNLYAVCYRISTGDLVYLQAPNVAVGNNYVFGNSTVIDTEGAVGAWADITLNGTTPYVSYLNSSMIGTFNGLKMAYYDSTHSNWEYMIAPLSTAISDNRTNIEYKKGSVDWTVSLGYKGSAFDIVQLKPEQP
jgi:hypothetical protein